MADVAKRKIRLSYDEESGAATRYRRLRPSGLRLEIKFGTTDESVVLEGVDSHANARQLKELISREAAINPCRQRLYLGGSEVESDERLLDFFPTAHDIDLCCSLELRCFVPLLISTQVCPGPMMAEIEVAPRNNEPVAEVKRRIRDKFRIETSNQRLYLHPAAMTTFTRRRPLGDARLLSFYLDPGADDNFLELVVSEDSDSTKMIFLKVPLKILVASSFFGGDDNDEEEVETFSKEANHPVMPPTPPQTPASGVSQLDVQQYIEQMNKIQPRYEDWWITLPFPYDGIIKRDPSVKDVLGCLHKYLLPQPHLVKETEDELTLKFAPIRTLFGGVKLDPKRNIFESYCVRSEETLMYVADHVLDGRIKSPPRHALEDYSPAADRYPTALEPLMPLKSYNETTNRYTMPFDACRFVWEIPGTSTIDCGAKPNISMEVSAVSFSRAYGSWDIPEHEKTYVEVIVEGSCDVGDLGLEAVLGSDTSKALAQDHDVEAMFDDEQRQAFSDYNGDGDVVYYVHLDFEVTVLGPVNTGARSKEPRRPSAPYMGHETRNWPFERRRRSAAMEKMRFSQHGNPDVPNPPPLRIKPPERCVLKTTKVDNDPITPSWNESRHLSKIQCAEWHLDKERISDVMVPGVRRGMATRGGGVSAFSTQCGRGASVEGRPYVSVKFKRQLQVATTSSVVNPRDNLMDSIRKAFDFRIQTQFYICHLISDPKTPSDSSPFTVRVRHRVARIDHVVDHPDDVTYFESPEVGMETTLNVALATGAWRKAKGLPLASTEDLNR